MSNNCLVRKLKGSVNNPELVKLGHFKIYPTNGGWFKATFYDGVQISSSQVELNNCYADSNLTSFTINDDSKHQYNITVTSSSPCIDFSSKYQLFRLITNGIDIDLDKLMPNNIWTLNINGNISGDITYIAGVVGSTGIGAPIEEFMVNGNCSEVTGDISELGKTHFIKNIAIEGLTNVHGDISNLGYTAYTLLNIYLPYNKNIQLELVDFVKKARKAGVYRDSNNPINFYGFRRIDSTLNGVFYDTNVCNLYWTANKIYACGQEIDNSEVEP